MIEGIGPFEHEGGEEGDPDANAELPLPPELAQPETPEETQRRLEEDDEYIPLGQEGLVSYAAPTPVSSDPTGDAPLDHGSSKAAPETDEPPEIPGAREAEEAAPAEALPSEQIAPGISDKSLSQDRAENTSDDTARAETQDTEVPESELAAKSEAEEILEQLWESAEDLEMLTLVERRQVGNVEVRAVISRLSVEVAKTVYEQLEGCDVVALALGTSGGTDEADRIRRGEKVTRNFAPKEDKTEEDAIRKNFAEKAVDKEAFTPALAHQATGNGRRWVDVDATQEEMQGGAEMREEAIAEIFQATARSLDDVRAAIRNALEALTISDNLYATALTEHINTLVEEYQGEEPVTIGVVMQACDFDSIIGIGDPIDPEESSLNGDRVQAILGNYTIYSRMMQQPEEQLRTTIDQSLIMTLASHVLPNKFEEDRYESLWHLAQMHEKARHAKQVIRSLTTEEVRGYTDQLSVAMSARAIDRRDRIREVLSPLLYLFQPEE